MAENNLNEDVIGVAFDGTGYGEDGLLWGGEFFTGSYSGYKRVGHLNYVKMPGGEMAIKDPWRMAVSYLYSLDENLIKRLSEDKEIGITLFKDIDANSIAVISQMLEKDINCPLTSSMGRLFDAISALLGVRNRINYEGQAAIELEYLCKSGYNGEYGFSFNNDDDIFTISANELVIGILKDIKHGIEKGIISSKFHETVANIVLEGCKKIDKVTGLNKVALSGGVFQNITLLGKCVSKLESSGFEVYTHSLVPANDGGISLGQAAIAIARIKKRIPL